MHCCEDGIKEDGDGDEDHIKDGKEEEKKTHISYFTSLYEGADPPPVQVPESQQTV